MRRHLLLAFIGLFGLTACAPRTVQDRPVVVKVPVSAPCAAKRPQKPDPLPSGWDSLDVRQKAAAVGKWALDWKGYGEQLEAATAACD